MKFGTALLLATAVHAFGFWLLWRTWPPPPPPEGEVVPLELRAVEPPPPPPPPVAAEPPAGGGGPKMPTKRARTQTVLALQPEAAGAAPVAAAPAAAATATGSGSGGSGSGSGPALGPGSAPTGSPLGVDHGPLKAQAMERIRQQRHYPELARRRRIEGTVVVAFRIRPDGSVADAHVTKGVDEMLDQAALEAVKQAAPLPGALSSDGELEVLLHFGLTP